MTNCYTEIVSNHVRRNPEQKHVMSSIVVVGSSVVSVLASGATSPRFDSRLRRGKFWCPNTLSFVSFAGMTLNRSGESRKHAIKIIAQMRNHA